MGRGEGGAWFTQQFRCKKVETFNKYCTTLQIISLTFLHFRQRSLQFDNDLRRWGRLRGVELLPGWHQQQCHLTNLWVQRATHPSLLLLWIQKLHDNWRGWGRLGRVELLSGWQQQRCNLDDGWRGGWKDAGGFSSWWEQGEEIIDRFVGCHGDACNRKK
jgi:hypothetical protein